MSLNSLTFLFRTFAARQILKLNLRLFLKSISLRCVFVHFLTKKHWRNFKLWPLSKFLTMGLQSWNSIRGITPENVLKCILLYFYHIQCINYLHFFLCKPYLFPKDNCLSIFQSNYKNNIKIICSIIHLSKMRLSTHVNTTQQFTAFY